MIKINTLLKSWEDAGYDKESITEEYARLHNAIQSLYENSLMSRESRNTAYDRLNKAYNQAIKRVGQSK